LKINRIFFDLDDTCNELTLHALEAFGCNIKPHEHDKYKPRWGYDILKAAKELYPWIVDQVTPMEFWSTFDCDFWSRLPESKEFSELLEVAEDIVGLENVLILTSPIHSNKPMFSMDNSEREEWRRITGECMAGKYTWITKHFPAQLHTQFAMCPIKRLCVAPDTLLIDDSGKNVNEFRAAGGQAILMPRPWNSMHNPTLPPIECVYRRLAEILLARPINGSGLRPSGDFWNFGRTQKKRTGGPLSGQLEFGL